MRRKGRAIILKTRACEWHWGSLERPSAVGRGLSILCGAFSGLWCVLSPSTGWKSHSGPDLPTSFCEGN